MDDEDDYEYEYSATDSETFYVDLDLSSVNNVFKSQNAGDRKSLKRPQASSSVNTPNRAKGKAKERQDQDDEDGDQAEAATPIRRDDDDEDEEEEAKKDTDVDLDGSEDSIQILELHSSNPIISLHNQIYSCQWMDMIGTTMFFTKHNETPLHEPAIATEDYDLISTSRIKLVGYKAKVTAKLVVQQTEQASGGKRATKPTSTRSEGGTREEIVIEEDEGEDDDEGQDERVIAPRRTNAADDDEVAEYIPRSYNATSLKRTDPEARTYAKRQANFLEKLRDIKRSRGEHDRVRTFVDRHTLEAEEKQKREKLRIRREIDMLNARVIKGDRKALERLQDIYSRIDEADSEGEAEDRGRDAVGTKVVVVATEPARSGDGEHAEYT